MLESKFLIGFVCFILFVSKIEAQSTSDCGKTKGCYLNPQGCVDSNCSFVYKWSDNNDKTDFEITALLDSSVSSDLAWMAVGFGHDTKMGDDCVVLCQHDTANKVASVKHYFNVVEAPPIVLDPLNPTIGLTNSSITANNGFLMCKFTRAKSVKFFNYFDLSKQYYLLGANGAILKGKIQFHQDHHTASTTLVNFQSTNIYN